jgi:hypothetical protein
MVKIPPETVMFFSAIFNIFATGVGRQHRPELTKKLYTYLNFYSERVGTTRFLSIFDTSKNR